MPKLCRKPIDLSGSKCLFNAGHDGGCSLPPVVLDLTADQVAAIRVLLASVPHNTTTDGLMKRIPRRLRPFSGSTTAATS